MSVSFSGLENDGRWERKKERKSFLIQSLREKID